MPPLYRQNAAVILVNDAKQVLICARSFPGYAERTLQLVQGGIDSGETPREAAEREVMEELGLSRDDFEIVDALEQSFCYEWPKEYLAESQARYPGNPYIGQEQYFFLAFVEPDIVFDLDAHHREFDAVWWGSPQELLEGMWAPKRPGTEEALRAFGLLN